MERYLAFIERYARSIIVLLVAITAYFTYALGSLTSDTNPYLLKETHPARKTIIDLQGEFTGTFDSVMVALHNPQGVFNQTSLNALYTLSQSVRLVVLSNEDDALELQRIVAEHAEDEVATELLATIIPEGLSQNDYRPLQSLQQHAREQSWDSQQVQFLSFLTERVNPIREMASMGDLENIVLTDEGELLIHKTLRAKDMDPAEVEAEIMGNELMLDGVVSRDKNVALLVAELGTKQDDAIAQLRAYQIFRDMVAAYQAEHPEFTDEVFIAGMPIFIGAQQEIIDHDLGLLFPVVFLLIMALLLVFFRKPLGVMLPLLNILFCTLWTLGLMALLEVPIDLLTSVLPVFLFTICCSDAVHIMSEYYEQTRAGKSSREANRETMRLMVMPVVLTTVTTIATFLLSTVTNIVSIRNFGMFMSIGLGVALLISLLLIPAWIALFGRDAKQQVGTAHKDALISRLLVGLCAWLIARRKAALLVLVPLMLVMTGLTFLVQIEDSGIAYFKEDNPFRISDEFVNAHVAGTAPGWIAIDSKTPRGVLDTEVVQFIDKLDRFLKEQPDVSYGYSLATYIKRMNLVLNDMDPSYLRVPRAQEQVTVKNEDGSVESFDVEGNALIEQHVMLFENGGGSDLTNVLNADYSKALVLYTMTSSVASDYQSLLNRLDAWLAVNKPANLEITHAGTPVIWTGVLQEITRGQILSFTLAVLAVTLMMMLWLRSLRLGLLGMFTLLTTSVSLYACMFLFEIELNIGTALVTFLVVGVVDYAVHLISRIKLFVQRGMHIDAAILEAMHSVGRSTVINVVIFSVGFLALLFSDYKPIIDLGGLVALALFISGVMTILVVTLISPWFFAKVVPVTQESYPSAAELAV
ncbi:RND family transporter [Pseudomonas leptonychotis]|uniref:Transporter n=1 Tax=Pseudomonas leptonychotis TaxID=2448482 RepID=A0A4T2A281_9PSED|nr:MMPL family transporter [Pseudomonas leptonychotis]TIH09201.1 transporter [Pseudomonas leptonychotis]